MAFKCLVHIRVHVIGLAGGKVYLAVVTAQERDGIARVAVARMAHQLDPQLVQASAEHCGTAAEIRAKQWPNHWNDRDSGVELVSTHPKKTWLRRGSKMAHGKFTFLIHLIACSNQNSRRPTIFWCPPGHSRSVDAER